MSGKDPLRLAILISGRGSNMVAIAHACAAGRINARVALVLSERPGVAGLDAARALGIEARVVHWPSTTERPRFERDLDAVLPAAQPDLIVLAGFMRILSQEFVEARAGRILNIHPSLLPKYR
ncbi:MAG: formyltransferase family protein, partial [Steroidobacteraceae bacterium]